MNLKQNFSILILISLLQFSCRKASDSEIASTGCNYPDTYMQVKNSTSSGGASFFNDRNLQSHFGYAGKGMPVTRKLTVDTDPIFSLSSGNSSPSFSLLDDSFMRVKNSLSGGAWVTYDSERLSNRGYVGAGIPVIRMETVVNSSGAKVAMINIRGGGLADAKAWASLADLEPRDGSTSGSGFAQGASTITSAIQGAAANAGVVPDSPSSSGGVKRRVMQVEIRGGSLANKTAWTLASNLEPRDCKAESPSNSSSNNGNAVDAVGNYDDPVLLQLGKSAVLCASGLGEGAISSGQGIVQGVWSVISGGFNFARTVVERDFDAILAIGSEDARNRLSQAGASDEAKVRAITAVMVKAVPSIHNYIKKESETYQQLSPPQQSRFMCRILGSASVELLAAVATGFGGGLQKNLSKQSLDALEGSIAKAEAATGIHLKRGGLCLSECNLPGSGGGNILSEIQAGYANLTQKILRNINLGGRQRKVLFITDKGGDNGLPTFRIKIPVDSTEDAQSVYRDIVTGYNNKRAQGATLLNTENSFIGDMGAIEADFIDKAPSTFKEPVKFFEDNGVTLNRVLTIRFHNGRSEEIFAEGVFKAMVNGMGLSL